MPEGPNLTRRAGTYYARIQVNGRDIRRSLRTGDRKQAKARLKELLGEAEEVRANPLRAAAERRWEEAVDRYLGGEFTELRASTQRRYETSIRMMADAFEGRPLAQITTALINQYAVDRMANGAKAATVRRDLSVASRVFRVAKRAGWTAANPVPEEFAELTEKRDPVRPVPLRDIALVIRAAPAAGALADLFRFCAKTGCRQEEAGSLERCDVDFARGEITFARTKTASPRVIQMTPQVRRILARNLAAQGPRHEPVFRNREGARFHSLPSRWRETRNASGAPHFLMHHLRHTFAIRNLQRGTSIYDLARHIGHSTVKTTEIYSGWLARRPG